MMAKRKKKHSGPRKGRRHVSGINLKGDTIQMAAGVILANVGSRYISSAITKALSTMDSKTVGWITAGGEMVGGYLLAKKSKSPLMKGAAIGLVAAGAGQALTNVGVKLSGVPVMIPSRGMVGYTRPMLNGTPTTNGNFPRPRTVGNATNSFPSVRRVGSRKLHPAVMAAGM